MGPIPGSWVVKTLPANAGDTGDSGSNPGSGSSPGKGNGDPLQYSCLENSMDRETWRAAVHEVAESDTTDQLTLSTLCHKSYLLGFKPLEIRNCVLLNVLI